MSGDQDDETADNGKLARRTTIKIRTAHEVRNDDGMRADEGHEVLCEARRGPHCAIDQHGILVVYKPPFWTMTTPEKIKKHLKESKSPEIQDWLMREFGDKYPFLKRNERAGLIHRLDVQTSGPILVATREDTFNEMRGQLQKKTWYKEYLALMHGAVPPKQACGVLTYRLKTVQEHGRGWRTEVDHRKGEHAETRYQAVEAYKCNRHTEFGRAQRYTLLRLNIITGRTHQIRVHLGEFAKELGFKVHGVVGDYKYLPPDQLRRDKYLCNRVFLHEQILEFPPPRRARWSDANQPYKIRCPLPPELEKVLGKLEKDERTTEQFRKTGDGFLRYGREKPPLPDQHGRRDARDKRDGRGSGRPGKGYEDKGRGKGKGKRSKADNWPAKKRLRSRPP